MTIKPSRRSVVAGAAWTVPAITIASATPAYAATADCLTPENPVEWQTVNLTVYSRVRTHATVLGFIHNRTDGMSKVDFTFLIPSRVLAGAMVPAQPISYVSTLTEAGTSAAYTGSAGIGARKVLSGFVNTSYNYGGGLTPASNPIRMDLNPQGVDFPSSGQLQTAFTGAMPVLTAGAPGNYTISFNTIPEPVEGNASTWNGSQTVELNNTSIGTTTARVHSIIPTTIPTNKSFGGTGLMDNDWQTEAPPGSAQSLTIATYEVVEAC